MNPVVNIQTALEAVTEHWSPKVVGRVNDQYIKVVKVLGEFVWHKHDDEDEMFHVVKGQLRIDYEAGPVVLNAGDFHIVPKGVMHRPVALAECELVLIEPVATKHTGDVVSDQTRSIDAQLA
ncbi:cupin domain-containing protein [Phaeovulum sp. W22_SRMD_FR3]|uniref:cupin domain-containing protein n=1 Tax=Phaeovulum sp. W22_SRMD_FR3 TaxID=3240274 RepID=UPI003F9ABF3C